MRFMWCFELGDWASIECAIDFFLLHMVTKTEYGGAKKALESTKVLARILS
jgi:hypothetical protein